MISELKVTTMKIIKKWNAQRGKVLKSMNRVTVTCKILSSCLPIFNWNLEGERVDSKKYLKKAEMTLFQNLMKIINPHVTKKLNKAQVS